MLTDRNPNPPKLLEDLCSLLQNPELPALLEQLGRPCLDPTLKISAELKETPKPSLLQRIDASVGSKTVKRSWSPLGEENPQKRRRLPASSGPSGRSLMSRSTPILPRFCPSNLLSLSLEDQTWMSLESSTTKEHPTNPERSHLLVRSEMHPDSILTMRTTNHLKNRNSLSQTCLGTRNRMIPPVSIATPVAKKPVGFFEHTTGTFPRPNSMLRSPPIPLPESLHRSGNESSREKQSTLTKSSRLSTMLSLMKRERVTWETRRSLLGSLNPGSVSRLLPNGPPLGGGLPKPSGFPSLTAMKNCSNMGTISNQNSQPRFPPPIISSSSTTLHCGMKWQRDNMPSSQTTTAFRDSTWQSSCPMESKGNQTNLRERNRPSHTKVETSPKFATNSMPGPAKILMQSANTVISAKTATNPGMEGTTARVEDNELYGLQLKYLRHNLWEERSLLSPTTAEWSETARPLPRPPPGEVLNPIAFKTITDHPDLFQVHTPIKVDVFEALLKNHLNRPFVNSVCAGLCDGFWPWADTMHEGLPVTHDES